MDQKHHEQSRKYFLMLENEPQYDTLKQFSLGNHDQTLTHGLRLLSYGLKPMTLCEPSCQNQDPPRIALYLLLEE